MDVGSRSNRQSLSSDIFLDGLFADATITVKGEDIPVHKVLLSMKSPVFMEAFLRTDSLVLDDVDPNTFRQFLHHLYTSSTPSISKTSADILVYARKFGTEVVIDNFLSHFDKEPIASAAPALLVVAHFLGMQSHKDKVMKFVGNHLEEIASTTEWKAVLNEFDLVTELILSRPPFASVDNFQNRFNLEYKTTIIFEFLCDFNSKVVGTFEVKIRDGSALFHIVYDEADNFNLKLISTTTDYPLFLEAEFQLINSRKKPVIRSSHVYSWFGSERNSEYSTGKFIFSLLHVDHYLLGSPLELSLNVRTTQYQSLVDPSIGDRMRQSGTKTRLNKTYCDVRFKAGNRLFDAHRIILARRSPVFAELVDTEDDPVVVDVEERTFETLLDYVYSDEFPKEELVDAQLLRSAKKFGFPILFHKTETSLIRKLNPRNCLQHLIAAFQTDAKRLKNRALPIVKSNVATIAVSTVWKQLAGYPDLISELLLL